MAANVPGIVSNPEKSLVRYIQNVSGRLIIREPCEYLDTRWKMACFTLLGRGLINANIHSVGFFLVRGMTTPKASKFGPESDVSLVELLLLFQSFHHTNHCQVVVRFKFAEPICVPHIC